MLGIEDFDLRPAEMLVFIFLVKTLSVELKSIVSFGTDVDGVVVESSWV